MVRRISLPARAGGKTRYTLLAVALLWPAATGAQTNSTNVRADTALAFQPSVRPSLHVPRAPGRITIDGALDDAGWAGAAKAAGFAENWPRERAKPSVDSEVWVAYDADHLYLAFLAWDDPSTIRASLRERDQIWQDDYFGILLDTYGDAAWAYYLFANPLGVQGDTRATPQNEDDGFDLIYQADGMVTDSGYQIEMAIPFASLRFPNRSIQTWRATFWRTRPRGAREQHTWAAIDRNQPCFMCQWGTLTGLEGIKPGGSLELLPTAVASQAAALANPDDPTSGLANGNVTGALGLDARYSFANGLTAEASVNPDFSQVESDAGQVDVNTTFALFFPERRPFFQEGSDLYETYFDAVYTRQINNPQGAAKLIGRMGRTTVAYLGARDEDSPILLPFQERSYVGRARKSFSNIGRFRQTFLQDSYVGALITDRRLEDGGSGSVAGVDGMFRFLKNYQLEYQVLGSHTSEPNDSALTAGLEAMTFDGGAHTAAFDGESFNGFAQYTSLERDARHWNFDFDYWASSPTFRADNGFESRNDFRRLSMWQGVFFYPKAKWINQFRASVFARREWTYGWDPKAWVIEPGISANLAGQSFVNVWTTFFNERFAGVEFDGLHRIGFYGETRPVGAVYFGLFASHGDGIFRDRANPFVGRGTDVELSATLQPLTRVVLQPSVVYSELNRLNDGGEVFGGFILRTRTNLQVTRELSMRVVVQYDDFDKALSLEPLLTYRLNPFSMFYIGSSLAYQDYDLTNRNLTANSRQIFTKLQYLLRW
jgi:Domain of unknown function (DUF5916)/Carbohydrate family 9 binding domain-like